MRLGGDRRLARRRSGSARVTTHASAGAGDRRRVVSSSPASASAASRRASATSGRRSTWGSWDRRRSGRAASRWRCAPFRRCVDYARQVMQRAPDAWIVNFTNPAGLVTQALTSETGARVVGICDTPTEVFQEVAHALGVPAEECRFDYVGLNHLGFIREVYWRGQAATSRVVGERTRLGRCLPDAAVLAGTAARAAPAAHRIRLLLRVARARGCQPARCG